MGGVGCRFKRLVTQTAADLSLTDTPVAQNQEFHVAQRFGIAIQVSVVVTKAMETIVSRILGKNFRRNVVERVRVADNELTQIRSLDQPAR